MKEPNQYKWKDKREAYQSAMTYLNGRRKGIIKSFQTPFSKMNDAGVSGIEWGTTVAICGRPGNFKTTLKDIIFNRAQEFNPGETFRILDISLEMSPKVTIIREFASVVQKSYKELCSADAPIGIDTLQECFKHAKKAINNTTSTIDLIEEPISTVEFKGIVEQYMELHKTDTGYTNTLIGIDHTRLFKKDSFEHSEEEMITNMGKMFTYLKKKYPIIFIVLSQLNRNIESPERNEDRKASAFPSSSDIFASDGLFQSADICLILNRPSLKNIRLYGSQQFIISDEGLIAVHYIKCRNGDTRLTFMKADGATMSITEEEPPPCATNTHGKNSVINRPQLDQIEQQQKPLQPNNLFTQENQ